MKKKGVIIGIIIGLSACSLIAIGCLIGIAIGGHMTGMEENMETDHSYTEVSSKDIFEDTDEKDKFQEEKKDEQDINENTTEEGNSAFYEAVKEKLVKKESKEGYALLDEISGDFDQDGYIEYILSFGEEPEEVIEGLEYDSIRLEKHFAVRVKEDEIQHLGECEIPPNGYGVYDLLAVRMENDDHDYIGVLTSNGASPLGCGLYQMKDDRIECIGDFSSPTGNSYAEFIGEEEGYEGISLQQNDYSTYYHSVKAYHWWNGRSFDEAQYAVGIDTEVTCGEDAVRKYLDLLWCLQTYEDEGLEHDIKSLLADPQLRKKDVSECVDAMYTEGTTLMGEDNLCLEVKENEEGESVWLRALNEGELNAFYEFKVSDASGSWQITDILSYGNGF